MINIILKYLTNIVSELVISESGMYNDNTGTAIKRYVIKRDNLYTNIKIYGVIWYNYRSWEYRHLHYYANPQLPKYYFYNKLY